MRCPVAVPPIASIVVTARGPISPTGSWHDLVATPSIWTVHAPHCAMPHPNLVPVRPSTSRNTHNRGVSGCTSALSSRPLTLISIMALPETSTSLAVCGLLYHLGDACRLDREDRMTAGKFGHFRFAALVHPALEIRVDHAIV